MSFIREIIFRPYRIVYRVNHEDKFCEIARVWHSARGILQPVTGNGTKSAWRATVNGSSVSVDDRRMRKQIMAGCKSQRARDTN
jgi:hypothetical protein